jgi:hypothetical protein
VDRRAESQSIRLQRRADGALFGYAVGPQNWKKYLHPADIRLFEAEQRDGVFRILSEPLGPIAGLLFSAYAPANWPRSESTIALF